jgi:hypothetical protein
MSALDDLEAKEGKKERKKEDVLHGEEVSSFERVLASSSFEYGNGIDVRLMASG